MLGITELILFASLAMSTIELLKCLTKRQGEHENDENGENENDGMQLLLVHTWRMSRTSQAFPIDSISTRLSASQVVPKEECCAICLDEFSEHNKADKRVTICSHTYCAQCFEDWYQKTPRCPLCNTSFEDL